MLFTGISCAMTPASPPPENIEDDKVIPNNTPLPYTFPLSKVQPTKKPGGSVKVVDSRTFKVAKKICSAEVEVEVGGMRYVLSVVMGMLLSRPIFRELHVCNWSFLESVTG